MYTFILAYLLFAAPADAPAEVAVARLDGTNLAGVLSAWDQDHVAIATDDEPVRISTEQLISLRWAPAPSVDDRPSHGVVELIDGTRLPATEFRMADGKATIGLTVAASAEADLQLTLTRQQLASVRLGPLDSAVASQWEEIRAAGLASDVLVVSQRDGKSLDYVEGVLGDVSDDRIEFKLDGESERIDRKRVAGIVFYRADRDTEAEPYCVVHGRSGLRARVRRAAMIDGRLQLTTVAGVEFAWPIEDVHLADFSAGKVVYLSDLDPASERWTPLIGLPAGATLAAEYGRPRRDQSAYGGPLSLSSGEPFASSYPNSTQHFSKGLALRSQTELIYRLPSGFQRFTATAGVDPATSSSGNVRLAIYGDDRKLLEADIAGHEPPLPIELDIAGVRRLKVLVDYGKNLDTGDWLNLCDARIVK